MVVVIFSILDGEVVIFIQVVAPRRRGLGN